MAELSLARDFPAAEEAAWQALVEEALKGAPFASLSSRTYDGIVIEPLYARAADASLIEGRAPGAPWARHAADRSPRSRRLPTPKSSTI